MYHFVRLAYRGDLRVGERARRQRGEMEKVQVAGRVRWLVLGAVGLLVAMTGCSSEEAARGPEPQALTAARAQDVLAEEGPTGEGRLPGGTFRFGGLFDSSALRTGGRLSAASWDIYWHRDAGARGAWGVGIDILGSPELATRALEDEAGFWCPGPRRGVRALESDAVDDVRAVSCPRGGAEGFYATLDATDGPVLTSLTVAGPTRSAAVADLRAVWPAVRDAVVRVRTALG